MALATFLHHKGVLGGVVGLSGALMSAIDWDKIDIPSKQKTPLFLYHGLDDPVVPIELAKHTYKQLSDHNLDFQFTQEQGLSHSLSMQEIN